MLLRIYEHELSPDGEVQPRRHSIDIPCEPDSKAFSRYAFSYRAMQWMGNTRAFQAIELQIMRGQEYGSVRDLDAPDDHDGLVDWIWEWELIESPINPWERPGAGHWCEATGERVGSV